MTCRPLREKEKDVGHGGTAARNHVHYSGQLIWQCGPAIGGPGPRMPRGKLAKKGNRPPEGTTTTRQWTAFYSCFSWPPPMIKIRICKSLECRRATPVFPRFDTPSRPLSHTRQTHPARDDAGKPLPLGATPPNEAPKRRQPLDRHPLPSESCLAIYEAVETMDTVTASHSAALAVFRRGALGNRSGRYLSVLVAVMVKRISPPATPAREGIPPETGQPR